MDANTRAMCVILGMAVDRYPECYTAQYIRECVDLKQADELKKQENRAIAYLAGVIGSDLYLRLMSMMEELPEIEWTEEDKEQEPQDVELVYDPGIAEEYRREQAAKAEGDITGGAADEP